MFAFHKLKQDSDSFEENNKLEPKSNKNSRKKYYSDDVWEKIKSRSSKIWTQQWERVSEKSWKVQWTRENHDDV